MIHVGIRISVCLIAALLCLHVNAESTPESAADSLRNAITTPRDQENVRSALRGMIRQIHSSTLLRRRFIEANGVELLVTLMRMHTNDASTAEWGGNAIVYLTMENIAAHTQRFRGSQDVITILLQKHGRTHRQAAFWLLYAIGYIAADGVETSTSFLEAGAVDAITDALRAHAEDTEIIRTACHAVDALADKIPDALFAALLPARTGFLRTLRDGRANADMSKETSAIVDSVMKRIQAYRSRHSLHWNDEFDDSPEATVPADDQQNAHHSTLFHARQPVGVTVEAAVELPSASERLSRAAVIDEL